MQKCIYTFVGMWGGVKFACYETPCNVTGITKHTGSKQAPKDICTDRIIGTWETEKPVMVRWRSTISIWIFCESSGMSDEVFVMKTEQ